MDRAQITAVAHRQQGFSLAETLVALTLLASVLLWTMALLVEEPRIQHRLDAHREVLEVLEAVHEEIRGGYGLPPGETTVDWAALDEPSRELTAAKDLRVWMTVEALHPQGLLRVNLRARYFVVSRSFERTLETLVWQGGEEDAPAA